MGESLFPKPGSLLSSKKEGNVVPIRHVWVSRVGASDTKATTDGRGLRPLTPFEGTPEEEA